MINIEDGYRKTVMTGVFEKEYLGVSELTGKVVKIVYVNDYTI